MLAIEFPPVSHLVEWPDLFGEGAFAVNKVVILMFLSAFIVFAVFMVAASRRSLVPRGVQNLAESAIEFIQEQIILQTMGRDGMVWTPFLLTLFTFIATLNLVGLLPGIQMPVNARIALPALMAVVVWFVFNAVGIAKQGPIGYFKSIMFPPGVTR